MFKANVEKNSPKFKLSICSLIIAAAALVLYLCTGKIEGFTAELSNPVIICAVIGIAANALFAFKRMDTLEMIPFSAYIISIFLFLAANANYIVAVIRAIDVAAVSATFVLTIALFAIAAVVYLVSFAFDK